jgi:hypothetical protein
MEVNKGGGCAGEEDENNFQLRKQDLHFVAIQLSKLVREGRDGGATINWCDMTRYNKERIGWTISDLP